MTIYSIRIAPVIATTILVCLIVFQLLLIFGIPLGYAAWGSEYKVLPLNLRIGSFISIVIYVTAIYTILSKSGIKDKHTNTEFVSITIWIFAILFIISAFLNFASKSIWERSIMSALSIILGLLFILVARSKRAGSNKE